MGEVDHKDLDDDEWYREAAIQGEGIAAAIRADIAAAGRGDLRLMELDIQNRLREAEAGRKWAMARDGFRKLAAREGLSEEEWSKKRLGRSLSTLLRYLQLYKNWSKYEAERRREGDSGHHGLLHALSLIPARDRYGMNPQVVRTRSEGKTEKQIDEMKLDTSPIQFICGDAREVLPRKTAQSAKCVMFSPPFWPPRRTLSDAGIGQEPRLEEYLENVLPVIRECRRVLRDDGTMWIEYEDAYSHSGGQFRADSFLKRRLGRQVMPEGIRQISTLSMRPAKSLLLIPFLVAQAILDDGGWLLRDHVIWDKGFARPDSADDRTRRSFSNIFMFTKRGDYSYDADPLRVPMRSKRRLSRLPNSQDHHQRAYPNELGRNASAVWRINSGGYEGTHPATWPAELCARMILPCCNHPDDEVLDPYGGAGTTAIVAAQLGFRATSIEIHREFHDEAKERATNSPARFPFADGPTLFDTANT